MTLRFFSKFVAISAAQLMCVMLVSAQAHVNPDAEAMAQFSKRVAAYLALQKKVEATLPSQKETDNPERIKAQSRAWPRESAPLEPTPRPATASTARRISSDASSGRTLRNVLYATRLRRCRRCRRERGRG